MSTHPRFWLITCIVLAISSCSAFGQQVDGHWLSGAEMSAVRAGGAATLLMDGRVLLSGGEGADGVLSSTETLVDGLLFVPMSPMNDARRDHVAVLLGDGTVLVAGGTTAGGAPTASAELYDPWTDTWTATGSLAEARSGAAAARLKDGRVLVAGGAGAGGALASLELYDPLSGTFTAVPAAMSSPRVDHAAALLANGRVLIAGGTDGVQALASTEIYDWTNDAVAPGPVMSTPRAGLSATALLDGTILLAGGTDGEHDLASAEICDASATACFATPGAMTTARRDQLAFALPANSSVLIAGGRAGASGAAVAGVELYRPWSGVFVPGGAMSAARADAAGTALGVEGVALVAGGEGQSSSDLYGFATVRTDCEDYPPGQPVIMTGTGWQPGEPVELRLIEVPSTHPEDVLTAVADGVGGIYSDEFAPEHHDIGVRFYLIATGSETQAATTFMDSPKVGAVLLTAQSGTPVYGTSSNATYTVTVQRGSGPGSSGNFTATLSLTTALPAGATASFSPSTVSLPAAVNSATSTLTITSGACTAPASSLLTVKAATSAADFATQDGTLTIAKRPLTVDVDPQSRSYGDANPALTASLGGSGLAGACGDTLADVGSLSTAATQCSAAGSYAIAFTAGGPKASFYTVTSSAANLTVTPRPLAVAIDPKSRGYGDANPALTATLGGSGLAVACGDVLADVGALTTAATPCSAAGVQPITFAATGPQAGNYAVTTSGADLTISARPITVVADAQSRVYGDANPALTASVGGNGLAGSCGDSLADVGALSVAATACSPVGTFPIAFTASGPKAANYLVSFTSADLTVDARPITVTAQAQSRIYGDSNSVLTALFGGSGLAATCGDSLADVGTLSTSATQCSAVGTFPILFAANGPKAGNYAVTFAGADLTVGPRPLSVAADAQSRVYGDANPTLTATLGGSGLAAACGDTLADVGSLSTAATPCSDVGTFAIGFATDGAKAGNYDVNFTGANLTVVARPITVAADTQSRLYGDANAVLTAALGGSGLAADCGDTLAEVGTLSTTATQCSDVGTFAITFAADGSEAGNYDVAFAGADLTVEPRPLAVTADAKSRLYGDANPALTASLGGSGLAVACGDELADVGTLSTAATPCSDVGAFAIVFTADGSKAGNYDIAYTGADLAVEARPITVTADAASRAYGDANPALTAQVGGSGLAAACGDALADVGTLSTAATQCSDVGTFAISFASDGPKAGNYDVAFAGADLTVEPRPLAVTADAQSRLYGDANPALTAQLGGSGLAAACGDTLADIGTLSTAATQCSNVGAFAITLATDGAKAGNYDVSFIGANLTVAARPIAVAVDAKSRGYGDSNPVLTALVGGSGLALGCGDELADVGTLSTTATPCSAVGSYPIAFTADGPRAANYAVSVTPASLTVTARPITITADAQSRVYGDANPALTAVVGGSGLASGCGDLLADVGALSTAATPCSAVGSYPITFAATGPKSGNYTVTIVGANLTVTRRALLVTAADKSIVLASPLPTFTAAYSGFACTDTEASLDTPVTFSPTTTPVAVGAYPITPAGATDANYDISFAPGVLTVTYAPVGGPCSGGHKIVQPINADGSSVFKKGSSVPAKFRVYDANCNSIGTPGVVTSFALIQVTSGTVTSSVNEVVDSTNASSAFAWDPTEGQWHFVISTKGATYQAGKTYLYRITLNDGSTVDFQFGLK